MLAVEGSGKIALLAGRFLAFAIAVIGDARRVGVGIEIDMPARDRPVEGEARAIGHRRLDLGGLAGLEGNLHRIGACGSGRCGWSRRFFEGWLGRGYRGGRRFGGGVARGLFGELHLDFAHLGEAERAADAGRIDRIFAGEDDRNEDRARGDGGERGRADQLAASRQVFGVGALRIEHDRDSFELADREAGELVADEHEARGHEDGVGGEGVAHEARGAAPKSHQDEDRAEREQLPDLDPDVEREEVGDEAIVRDLELEDLRREAEAVEEAEDQCRGLGVRLKAEPALIGAEIVERLVDDRQADDRIDDIGVGADAGEHAEQHRRRVSTSVVNEVLEEALKWHTPPTTRQGRQGRIYYGTQVTSQPPTVTLFVNDPKLFNDNYRRYIERQFRQQLGFKGTPIRLFWRGKKMRDLEQSANRATKV